MMNPTREVPLGEGSETDYLANVPPPGKATDGKPLSEDSPKAGEVKQTEPQGFKKK